MFITKYIYFCLYKDKAFTINASTHFMYNKIFVLYLLLGKKTPYPLLPVFYANYVQTNRK